MTILSDIELQSMDGSGAAATMFNSQIKQNGINHIDNENDDDDNMTIIFLETESSTQNQSNNDNNNTSNNSNNNNNLPNWVDRLDHTGDPIFDERRRTILLQELKRIQRRSFFNFVLLCTIPLLLFVTMIIIVFSGDSDKGCLSTITYCRLEQRSFVNAFTTRCLCDPIPVERNTTFG
jgi:hypothetical protein